MLTALLIALHAQTGTPADAFMDRLAESRAEVTVFRAEFLMENRTADDARTSPGRLLYVRPRRLVMRVLDQETLGDDLTYIIDGASVYEQDHALDQVSVYERQASHDLEALFAAFESDLGQLRAHYDIELFDPGDEAVRAAHGVVLRPRPEEGVQPMFERVRIFLRADDYLPVRIHIVNNAESDTVLTLSELEVNGPVAEYEDRIRATPGMKIIVNDTDIETVTGADRFLPEPAAIPEPPAPVPGVVSEEELPAATEPAG
jgi:outer membrane lipoprotein-sorting protein